MRITKDFFHPLYFSDVWDRPVHNSISIIHFSIFRKSKFLRRVPFQEVESIPRTGQQCSHASKHDIKSPLRKKHIVGITVQLIPCTGIGITV